MAEYNSYCKYTRNLDEKNVHRIYHDNQYGFPIDSLEGFSSLPA